MNNVITSVLRQNLSILAPVMSTLVLNNEGHDYEASLTYMVGISNTVLLIREGVQEY